MKAKAFSKHSLHEKTAASVFPFISLSCFKLFISGNERCHTTDAPDGGRAERANFDDTNAERANDTRTKHADDRRRDHSGCRNSTDIINLERPSDMLYLIYE